MDLRRISPALTQRDKLSVVSIADVKAQARVTDNAENDLIAHYIETAFDHLHGPEGWLNGYCLLEEEYEFFTGTRDTFVEIPLRPLPDLTTLAFSTRATDGTYTDIDTGLYYVSVVDDAGVIRRASTVPWPLPLPTHDRFYRITFRAGHEYPQDVPSPIRLAIKMLAAFWYSQRETVSPAGRNPGAAIPFGLQSLCGRYRRAHDHS